jgi:hypothetical protein
MDLRRPYIFIYRVVFEPPRLQCCFSPVFLPCQGRSSPSRTPSTEYMPIPKADCPFLRP